MPAFKEIVVETYMKEVEISKAGSAVSAFLVLLVLGLVFWPLILLAFIVPFMIASGSSKIKCIALECPKCAKEIIITKIPFKDKYRAGQDSDFTKSNNFNFQCQHCNAHMDYLNGYAIYKTIADPFKKIADPFKSK